MKKEFKAPWSNRLRVTTLFVLAIMALIAFSLINSGALWPLLLLLVIVAGTFLLGVSGYAVGDSAIIVRRIGWQTRLPLEGLQSVEIDPDATAGSLRLFGVGGLFAFVGRFRNKRLGNYRAYVTDAHNSVVLRYPDRTIVVSPDDPQAFVAMVTTAANLPH